MASRHFCMTENKRKRGRPKVADSKGVMISSRFTLSEVKAIESAYRKTGLTKTEWIRKTLTDAAQIVIRNT